ncbi:MAG: cellulase family glycosylhydrolase [Kiritimatiellae bacterium]|nr:cellulase family glycosylhydrolase [Kiritimatiellia bacterium]
MKSCKFLFSASLAALCTGCSMPQIFASGAGGDSQIVQTRVERLPRLGGLVWSLPPKYVSLEGDKLVVDVPEEAYGADAVASAFVPAEMLENAPGFAFSVRAAGSSIAKPTKNYLGLKVQLHLLNRATGRESWINCSAVTGDFEQREIRTEASFAVVNPNFVELQLGLQGTSGRVEFDLSTLRGAPSCGIFRLVNQDWRVRYPETVSGDSRRRGFMLPQRDPTADDFETLASWGVTLVRYQIVRNWSKNHDNQDLAEFNEWLEGKFDCLETTVLPLARKYGMKVVVDLHVTPGGRTESREMAMFWDATYAREFVDIWRRIAARFRDNADVIYGYDLVNEPKQLDRAPFDYWTLQRLAAEAVREIDPETPIIIESNLMDAPSAFSYLSPLRMDNVIYQVHCYTPTAFTHQGVHGRDVGLVWPDPDRKWDKDFIRATMAPVREFELKHNAKIYVGEFSAIAWAEGAEKYLEDCMDVFEEYGWDWTYHAFREWSGWSLEHEGPDEKHMAPSADNPRKKAILAGLVR